MEKSMYNEIKEKARYCLKCKNPSCQKACPLGNNIPKFIGKIEEEKYKEAYEILSETTVMQAICGLICPYEKQCQEKCIKNIKGEAVKIGELEAFIGNLAIENNWYSEKKSERVNKKIAVIGGGPAGLTCSAFLAKNGYDLTIYEKDNKLGGLLLNGIPDFRLKKDIVNEWIKQIITLGINVKYNKKLGDTINLDDLCQKYDAVFLSIGANKSIKLGVKGEELEGVYGANELLETNSHPDYRGKVVSVIGGGNVAIDIARTIKKKGADKVYIIYRRAEKQMPAEAKEIKKAKLEGIEFLFQNNIVKIIGEDKVEAIELIKTELVKKETEAREVPVDIVNSNYQINVDYLIRAIGSVPERNDIYGNIILNSKDYIKVDDKYNTSNIMVFAGGDIIGTKTTVAYAAMTGREAAKAIDNYLKGREIM